MKVGTSRFACSLFLVVCAILFVATQALGQSPSFSSFPSDSGLILNGNASVPVESGVLRLTPAISGQHGSAWFNVQQPVQNGFTTSFSFQFSSGSTPPADGIAFVIQNSGTNALGGGGGGIGYQGIGNSVAVEFDSFLNGPGSPNADPDAHHVAIQSCGTLANTADHTINACGPSGPTAEIALQSLAADFGTTAHNVTITYLSPSDTCSGGCLQVNLDGANLFPGNGATVNLGTLLNLTNGTAYVGFTGATGAAWEQQDVLSWTYQATVTPDQPTVFEFQNNAFTYQAQLNQNQAPVTAQVVPIVMSEASCNALVQRTYTGAKCFVYKNAGGTGTDGSVLLELTCPNLGPHGECDPFDAELGTTFDLSTIAGVNLVNSIDPFPGWLKGGANSPDQFHPCAIPAGSTPLFQNNQVDFFMLEASDPFTKGGSGGTGSCWVATYNQPDEQLVPITITSPTATTYTQGQMVAAAYSCADPPSSHATGTATGPYLKLAPGTCAGPVASGSNIDTSTFGLHTFTVHAQDTGENQNSKSVTYTVLGPSTDLAIAQLGPLTARTGSKITYTVGVGDLGSANATNVTITDTLPTGTTFVSATANREVCTLVKLKLSCAVTPVACTSSGSTVSCNVGAVTPLSISSLNGGTAQITVKITTVPPAKKTVTITNKAVVSSDNADPKPGNNTASFSTIVTN